MKNKNAILIELSTSTVAELFGRFYRQGLGEGESVPKLIEEECEKRARSTFDDRDRVTDGDIHLMKMHAVGYYEQYFSKILEDRLRNH